MEWNEMDGMEWSGMDGMEWSGLDVDNEIDGMEEREWMDGVG